MNQKAKNSGRIRRIAMRIMGKARTRTFLGNALVRKGALPALSLPIDASLIKSLLCIMPTDPIDTVHQIGTILSLMARFKDARISLLCNSAVSSFVKNLQNAELIEYDDDDCVLFSKKFAGFEREFRGRFDICIMLEKNPPMPLLQLAGQTASAIRAGFEIDGGYPFLNYRIRPSGDHTYIGDWNGAIATLFGTRPVKRIRWAVAKLTLDEVRGILKESAVPLGSPLIGIDLVYFVTKYGRSWSEALVRSIKESLHANIFIYSEYDPDSDDIPWLRQWGWPIISGLSVSRTAALVSLTSMMITGNTVLFAMSGLLDVTMIGIFEEKERDWNCPNLHNITGISYAGEPGPSTIDAIIKAVKARVKA